jgi:hypothetical protein
VAVDIVVVDIAVAGIEVDKLEFDFLEIVGDNAGIYSGIAVVDSIPSVYLHLHNFDFAVHIDIDYIDSPY